MALDALEQLAGERTPRYGASDQQIEWAVPWAIWVAAGAMLMLDALIIAAVL